MEVDTAVRRELLRDMTVASYVGTKVFRHTVWERLDNQTKPHGDISGSRAVMVKRFGGWSTPDRIKTPEWPRVLIECWSDCDRNDDGEMKEDNGIDNAYAVYRAVDNALRAKGPGRWGQRSDNPGLEVIGLQRLEEPVPFGPNDVPPDIAESMGDLRYVSVVYGFQVIHGTLVS